MKKIMLVVILYLTTNVTLNAQFDDRFYFPSKEWEDIENMKYEELFFNVDTCTLHAIFLKPKSTPKATIVFFHGSGGNVTTYTNLTRPLVNGGYQVFMLDPRGYGKSTGKPTHVNIAHDAQIIFDSIVKRKDIKNTDILIYGASMGTQVAVKLTKDNPKKIDGLILDGPVSSFTDIAMASAPENQKAIISQYVVSPYSAKKDIKEINNIPKLIIHSKADSSVPFSQGKTVYENASDPKEFWVYKGEHLEAITLYPEIFLQKIDKLMSLQSEE
jgi:hypothetical protein